MRTSSARDPDAGIMSVKDAVNINEMIMEVFRVYPKIIKRGGLCYIASNGTEFNVGYYKGRYEMYFCNTPYVLF